ncbi:FAD-dependent oxidoreductase [Caballeronia novacaledonica]|uniref:FAD-dependent oxidoreductase n=1 Tax=Caballeronia novacaledonica TaxID=1544861 RepID=A0A2U3I3D0_9BURK|nr:L-2-hydroxyglutarate oxidase [Caballeronia novacaledonica]SPB14635.1 FAD-dependent oxidoreductase [Caballeronia novacaledonica]
MNAHVSLRNADADVIVIGGGIIGASTSMQLTERYPSLKVLVLEKEDALAVHQSGHNSGVIHAGVYYAPGSLKADFCRRGAAATYAFSRRHDIRFEQCGKLIVATNAIEVQRLKDLFERCRQNQLRPQWLDRNELTREEPRIVGEAAMRVASSGIADYPSVTRAMASVAHENGATLLLCQEVIGMSEDENGVTVTTKQARFRAKHAIVCAGLMADRFARMCKLDVDFRIVPFRGEYYRLPASKNDIVRHLIYPVPDPALPFLGVHLTRMIGGYVTVGPNAVLAMAREGYRWRDIDFGDLAEMATFGGFWKMLKTYGPSGLSEVRNSLWKSGYLALCQKYCPELSIDDLEPYPAGVRAQAVSSNGALIHDFLIRPSKRSLHVCNAPSPAATSALPIGEYLVDAFSKAFGVQPHSDLFMST